MKKIVLNIAAVLMMGTMSVLPIDARTSSGSTRTSSGTTTTTTRTGSSSSSSSGTSTRSSSGSSSSSSSTRTSSGSTRTSSGTTTRSSSGTTTRSGSTGSTTRSSGTSTSTTRTSGSTSSATRSSGNTNGTRVTTSGTTSTTRTSSSSVSGSNTRTSSSNSSQTQAQRPKGEVEATTVHQSGMNGGNSYNGGSNTRTETAPTTVVRRDHNYGTICTTAPVNYTVVTYNGCSYRYCDGVYYRPSGNNYIICRPPVGAVIAGCYMSTALTKVVVYDTYHRATVYYYDDGVFYNFNRYNNSYTVCRPPIGAVVSWLPTGVVRYQIGNTIYYVSDGVVFVPTYSGDFEVVGYEVF